MKKFIIFLLLSLSCVCRAGAEDVLQILPQRIYAGSTSADGRSFTIQMNNDNVFAAFQFDLYLPDGMELDDDPFELSMDRFPYTIGRGGVIKFSHDFVYAKRSDGAYRVVVSANDLESKVSGNSGDLLTVYYVTDNNMKQGVMPVMIKNVVLAINGTTDVKPQPASSFFYSGNIDFSTIETLNLSELTNTMLHDVVEEINGMIGENMNLTEIDVTGLDGADAEFVPGNKNCMVYVKDGTPLAESFSSTENVVKVAESGNRCENLILHDGYALNISRPFTAGHATYQRTLPGKGWYSLCLPYKADIPENVITETFEALEKGGSSVVFTNNEQDANIPCIFYTDNDLVTFSADEVNVNKTLLVPSDNIFTGTYKPIPSGEVTGCYALHSNGIGFGRTGETACVEPFHAYLDVKNYGNVISLVHGNTTSIENIVGNEVKVIINGKVFTLNSCEDKINIRRIDGSVVENIAHTADSVKSFCLKSGIYIINNTKIIVK